jgi:TolB protein
MNLKSLLTLKTYHNSKSRETILLMGFTRKTFCDLRKASLLYCAGVGVGMLLMVLFWPAQGFARIYIDINAPSIQKFKIAIPDFKNMSGQGAQADLATKLPGVVSNDLDMSGYFNPMDKAAFLEEKDEGLTLNSIHFKNWSVIGAELLLRGSYSVIGSSVEVEIRLFDVFLGKQILGKRALGEISDYRRMMHRLGNEIMLRLTGQLGIFLTKLAYVGKSGGKKEIFVSDYDGHDVRQVTSDKSIALLPRWSPDGRRLIYTSYKEGGPMVYLHDMASGTVQRISARPGLNTGGAWSPDGTKLAITLSETGNSDIFIIDLSGKILKRVTEHWGIDVSPTFSPDGKKIAFVSNRSGSPQIYIHDLAKGTEERLTFEGSYNTSPVWSSLNRIAFTSMDQGKFKICSINPDGSRYRKLTEDHANSEDACWSPGGRYLAFASDRDGQYHIYMMTATGQNQRRITYLPGDQTSPSWAP